MAKGNKSLILVVDDDELDFMALKREFAKIASTHELIRASDGRDAMDYLQDEQNRRPSLILLDLNMPRVSGLEFLDELRSSRILRSNLVFVLTTSDNEKDKIAAYEKNVAGYIVKNHDGFADAVQMIDVYLNVVDVLHITEND